MGFCFVFLSGGVGRGFFVLFFGCLFFFVRWDFFVFYFSLLSFLKHFCVCVCVCVWFLVFFVFILLFRHFLILFLVYIGRRVRVCVCVCARARARVFRNTKIGVPVNCTSDALSLLLGHTKSLSRSASNAG